MAFFHLFYRCLLYSKSNVKSRKAVQYSPEHSLSYDLHCYFASKIYTRPCAHNPCQTWPIQYIPGEKRPRIQYEHEKQKKKTNADSKPRENLAPLLTHLLPLLPLQAHFPQHGVWGFDGVWSCSSNIRNSDLAICGATSTLQQMLSLVVLNTLRALKAPVVGGFFSGLLGGAFWSWAGE